MYIVCDTEADIDLSITLTKNRYKFQRVDGKWITPFIDVSGLPAHTVEQENISWYDISTKQYDVLYSRLTSETLETYKIIDEIYLSLKNSFSAENVLMGISGSGHTQLVIDSLIDFDTCMRSRAIDAVWVVIDNIPRSTPYLTDERINKLKGELYTKLVEVGIL